jgi:hypothetical protein
VLVVQPVVLPDSKPGFTKGEADKAPADVRNRIIINEYKMGALVIPFISASVSNPPSLPITNVSVF